MTQDEKLNYLLIEVETIKNYLKQQVKNDSIIGVLEKQRIEISILAHHEYKN